MLSLQRGLKYGLVACLVAVMAVALAACGGGDDSTGSETGSSEPASTESSGGGGSALISDCESMIEASKEPFSFEDPGPAIDTSSLKGKSIAFISLSQAIPTVAEAAEQTAAAGEKVGIKVDVWDGKGELTRMQQGMENAVTQGADAMVLLGVPTELVQGSLAKAAAANIPVVTGLNNQPEEGAPGQGAGENIFATSAPSYKEAGELQACQAIVSTEGEANVVIFGAEELQPAGAEVEGITTKLDECEACEYTTNSTPAAEWEIKLPGLTQSVIRSSPDVNFMISLFDGMGIFVTTGIRQAGATGDILSSTFNGTPPGLELVQEGDILIANPGQSNGYIGYLAADQAMRGMLGEPPANPQVPIRFFDQENLEGVDVNDETALYGNEFEAGFEKLWGVG